MLSCACVLALMLVLGISEARIVAGNTTTIGAFHATLTNPSPQRSNKTRLDSSQNVTALTEKLFINIDVDLEPWLHTGITKEMVEHTYCSIVDGEMYIVGETAGFYEFNHMTKLFISEVAARYKLPDVDMMITTADNCPDYVTPVFGGDSTKCPLYAPMLANSKTFQQKNCVLYPAFSFSSGGWPMPFIPSWKHYQELIKREWHNIPQWVNRIPKLFFRGAPTGPRFELFRDNTLRHSRVEASLTSWTEARTNDEHVSLPAHCEYKYLLHLPGHGYSARLKYLLLCGSSVIFYDNGKDEFFYHILEDKKHFFKVVMEDPTRDAARFLHALRELEINPELAEQIADGGRMVAEQVLTTENVEMYFAKLVHKYASLQKFKPEVHPDAVPFRYSLLGPDANFNVWTRNCSFCQAPPPPTEDSHE